MRYRLKAKIMAELNQNISNSGKNRRSLKPLPKVDLTAMVDLAFLLITFFMLTTSLSKPSAMHVAMPIDEGALPVSQNRAMTVCLGADDQVLWYIGTTYDPQYIRVTDLSKIRSDFQNQMKEVLEKSGKSLMVLIKPSEKANFKNLVDLLDELEIVKVSSYAIVDITSGDKKLMIQNSVY
jgi:biopolymer transport protein ExbD